MVLQTWYDSRLCLKTIVNFFAGIKNLSGWKESLKNFVLHLYENAGILLCTVYWLNKKSASAKYTSSTKFCRQEVNCGQQSESRREDKRENGKIYKLAFEDRRKNLHWSGSPVVVLLFFRPSQGEITSFCIFFFKLCICMNSALFVRRRFIRLKTPCLRYSARSP